MLRLDIATQEDGSTFVEGKWVFGSKETIVSVACQSLLYLGMALQIVLQTASHIFPLRNEADVRWRVLPYLAQE